jgi:phosphoribosylanthranilate isomerase
MGFILYKASPRFISLKDAAAMVKIILPSIVLPLSPAGHSIGLAE